ncbi:MAG: hypothetical protein NW200_08065 [Hyphomonadaceae bacterium]|nr:hypothetical protein [Hyphomonadaceae bacterium]
MTKTAILARTAILAAAAWAALAAPGLAQSGGDSGGDARPAAVTPQQIEAAEKLLQLRAGAAFRPAPRTPAQRLAAARAAVPGATLGPVASVGARTAWAEGRAWLNGALASTDAERGLTTILAYDDAFAPLASLEVVIPNAPASNAVGRRHLVECAAHTVGASATRVTVRGVESAVAPDIAIVAPILQEEIPTSAPGSVISVVTPATNAAFVRVKLDISRGAMDAAAGTAALVIGACEVSTLS